MRKYLATFLLFLGLFLFSAFSAKTASAASLRFDTSSVSVKAGDTFQIQIIVDPGADSITSADVYVQFDQNLLEFVSSSAGSYFPNVSAPVSSPGKVYIAGYINFGDPPKNTPGTLATFTLKGLNPGNATLSFICDLESSETSKIIKDDENSSNIIVCSQNGSANVTITSEEGENPTPTPTSAPEPTESPEETITPTPVSDLPAAGGFQDLVGAVGPGLFLILVGIFLKVLL